MKGIAMRAFARTTLAVLACASFCPAAARAQGSGEGFSVRNSGVGYIDPAIPGTMFRIRADASYDSNRPSRDEFFYPQTGPAGPGVPGPETRIDYQELSGYLEVAPYENLSAFLTVPFRFLNPEINANAAGLSDMNAGFKWAFLSSDDGVATFQLRTYAPTGNAGLGLGTRHVSLEPALLTFVPLTEALAFEGELRYWVPIGGTDFAGSIIRYGAGLRYEMYATPNLRVMPVVEFVGWTSLGGKESVATSATSAVVQDATGDTIVNVKAGVRFGLGEHMDVYAGYGRALTGDVWYKDTVRLEARLLY
jgi:hypothetical protein